MQLCNDNNSFGRSCVRGRVVLNIVVCGSVVIVPCCVGKIAATGSHIGQAVLLSKNGFKMPQRSCLSGHGASVAAKHASMLAMMAMRLGLDPKCHSDRATSMLAMSLGLSCHVANAHMTRPCGQRSRDSTMWQGRHMRSQRSQGRGRAAPRTGIEGKRTRRNHAATQWFGSESP